ncbi:MAG: inositol monophosphatase family protein [bacterium]|nr:inositol monophosphatase family protein [bacterium]
MPLDLLAAREVAETAARQAAEVVMRHYHAETIQEHVKQNPIDIVTEADREAERVIVELLTQHFPDHHLVGEEGGGMGAPAAEAEYFWYIDPVDGTTNFANRLPYFSTSIALTDATMQPLVGVVYQPVADELFSAAKGYGTTLNNRPIRVSARERLEQSVLCSGFPYDQATNPDNNMSEWHRFAVRTRGLRRFGSAALDLCYVAAGRLEGYWEQRINPWDYLGGLLCVTEAGGTVTDYEGGPAVGGHPLSPINPRGRIVASNSRIHQQMLDVLALST